MGNLYPPPPSPRNQGSKSRAFLLLRGFILDLGRGGGGGDESLLFQFILSKIVDLQSYAFSTKESAQPCIGSHYCWFSHDVTKIQTKKLSILPRFYFHDALEQLKTNFHTNFRFKRVLGFVIEDAWISKLLRDAIFTWRPRELLCRLKKWLISGNFAI